MKDSDGRETENKQTSESDQAVEERKSEATTNKKLSDLEETETDSRSTDTGSGTGPSPDGMLDEPDESKDAGPM